MYDRFAQVGRCKELPYLYFFFGLGVVMETIEVNILQSMQAADTGVLIKHFVWFYRFARADLVKDGCVVKFPLVFRQAGVDKLILHNVMMLRWCKLLLSFLS